MPVQLKISCYGCQSKLDVSDLEPFTKIECPVCQTKIIIPKPFGNLLLEENIGDGLISVVYRAMDITLDREIAVKVLKPAFAEDTDIPQQFINEARSASAINHPNVIPIYSCGREDNQPFIIMQFMEGGSLARRLQRAHDQLPLLDVCKWLRDAARGLESAYIHGVLHHDVRPSNIFLDLDGNIKMGDFGLSQAVYRDMPLRPDEDGEDGIAPVTLARAYYVSPEKINTGRQDVSGDLYSLGASFYHVLTGVPPFPGDTPETVLKQHLEVRPRPAAELRHGVPAELSELLARLLATYPSDRPKSYAEVVGVLEDVIDKLGGNKRFVDTGEMPAVTKPSEPAREKPAPRKSPPAKRKNKPIPVVQPRVGLPGYRPERSNWFWQLLPIVVIIALMVLFFAHMQQWEWYTTHVLPLLPVENQEIEQP